MIHPAVLVSGGLANPLDVGESLDNEPVGVDDAKDGQVGTTTSKDEGWTTTLFKEGLTLKGPLK